MHRYRLILEDGDAKVYQAKSGNDAKIKYYDSQDHFRTERYVDKVQKLDRQPRKKNNSLGIFGGSGGFWDF